MNRLNIATFNIDKDNDHFPERINNLLDVVYRDRFDILCLQEDYYSEKISSGKLLNTQLEYNYISTKTREKERNNTLSSSNLTILSKYPIQLLEEIYFDKEQSEERAFQLVKIEIKETSIILVNTHLCHLSEKRRLEHIKIILEKLKNYTSHIKLFCGDLNALPNSEEIQLIKDEGFIDKNNDFTHEDKITLDYIFYKSDKILDVESKILLKGFSDHHCLLNSFDIFNNTNKG